MSTKFLLKGGCVLTLGTRTPNFGEADVLVDGDRIAEVGPGLRARDAEQVDARDTIVMPGFVDAHRHAWKTLFRNSEVVSSEVDLQPDDVYAATFVGLLGAAEAGITTVVDWADHRFPEAALEAHRDSGLRTALAVSPPSERSEHWGEKPEGPSGAMAPTIVHGSDDSSTWAEAREAGLAIHAHARSGGTIARWKEEGQLGPDVTLIHCSHASDADLDAVLAAKASVVLTPATEMSGEAVMPLIQRIIGRGLRPGLGVDSAEAAPGDLFAQMRSVISLQHATVFDLKLAGKAGLPHLMTTREVIRYGTLDGARAIGLGSVTGSIEAGKQADLIVLRADRPNIAPINDPIGAVVWGMDTSNVDWVFVAGRPL
ncbi:MAG TPA: amidohydrolase family protein, partial [Acidimicrobiia bacterium]|nr:amidohydrolase family protein [Acidimicrobiia bacterium]